MAIERQELYCHNCEGYVQFSVDLSLNGNHVLECPNCRHEHCRVVRNGRITDIRWDQRNGPSVRVTHVTYTTASTYSTASTSNIYLYGAWMNTTSAS